MILLRRRAPLAPQRYKEVRLFNIFRNLPLLAIAVGLGASSASATVAVQVYTFTGDCTDCTGTGMATLILLGNYVLGTPLSADDLYSFNYSSNLIPDLSIHDDSTAVLDGRSFGPPRSRKYINIRCQRELHLGTGRDVVGFRSARGYGYQWRLGCGFGGCYAQNLRRCR